MAIRDLFRPAPAPDATQPVVVAPGLWPEPNEVGTAIVANRRVNAAAGPRYEDELRPGLPDFQLDKAQIEVDTWTDSVGWLGYFVDVVATLGSGVDLMPQQWGGEEWIDEDSPLMHQMLDRFFQPADALKPVYRSRAAWMRADLERLMRVGEFAVWADVATGSIEGGDFRGWFTAHPVSMSPGRRTGEFVARLRPDARPDSEAYITGETSELMRMWDPQPRYPYKARVPIHRIKREVAAYMAQCARVEGDAHSRLLAGLLWINVTEDDAKALAEYEAGEGPTTPAGSGLPDLIRQYGEWTRSSLLDIEGGDLVAKVAPFLWPHHSEPKPVVIGSEIDENALKGMKEILEHAARGLNIPMDFLLMGVGEANHWNSAEKRRALNNQAVYPVLQMYLDFWSDRWRRWLQLAGMPEHEASRRRIHYDPTPIALRDDNVAQVLSAHRLVGFRRAVIAQVVGKTEADLIPLPDGITEDEFTLERITPGANVLKLTPEGGAERDTDPNPSTDEALDPGSEPITDRIVDA